METRIYNDVALHGALVMSKNESGFPENPQVGTIIVKDYCLYAYIRIGGMETWYPFANKTNSYVHVQGEAALTWTVVHNLGTADVWIQVNDESGNIVQVGKTTIDENSFTLNFTQATKGTVVVVAPDTIDVPGVKATSINVANDSVIIDNSGVRVNGSYVLTSANIETQINNAVAVETSARIAADANLQSSIDAEVTARAAADTTLQANIDAEVARATGVEGLLTNLTTTAKTNLVSAINEVKGLIPATGVRYIGAITSNSGISDINPGALYYVTAPMFIYVYDVMGNIIEVENYVSGDCLLVVKRYLPWSVNINTNRAIVRIASGGSIGAYAKVESSSFTLPTTAANQSIGAVSVSTARSIKYTVQVAAGTSYQVSEILLIHDDTNVSMTQYGVVTTGSELATFDADISAGYVRLLTTPVNANTTFKIVRSTIAP